MTQKKQFGKAALAAAIAGGAMLWAGGAGAIMIEYELFDLGGSNYRYVYTVTNDGSLGGAAVEGFQILFHGTEQLPDQNYNEASLAIVTGNPPSAAWDELILGAVPGFDPAAYDAAALGAGIGNGASVSGFAVEFEWIGAATGPGAQEFIIYDPNTFAELEFGTTQLKPSGPGPGPTPAPAPGVLSLLGAGLLGLGWMRRRAG